MGRKLTESEIQEIKKKISVMSNKAQFKQISRWLEKLIKDHPEVLMFRYLEAVYYAEDTMGLSVVEADRRYRVTARKLRRLLFRLRGADDVLRNGIRNEYYWFSKQPRKQYALGLERNKQNPKDGFYSQGVGAAQLAQSYALKGRKALANQWAKRSERAWLAFFEVRPDWFNSYFFYAMSLGLQGREKEMIKALQRAAKIAGKPFNWKAIVEYERDIRKAARKIEML